MLTKTGVILGSTLIFCLTCIVPSHHLFRLFPFPFLLHDGRRRALRRSNKGFLSHRSPVLRDLFLSIHLPFAIDCLTFSRFEEEFSACELQVEFARVLRRWEWSVNLFDFLLRRSLLIDQTCTRLDGNSVDRNRAIARNIPLQSGVFLRRFLRRL